MGLRSTATDTVNRLLGRLPSGGTTADNTLTAAYRKAPSAVQEEDLKQSYKMWRDEKYWESFAHRYLPDLGLAFSVSPWVTAWELIWGASPVQDLAKYKELSQKVPYIYSALMLQANLTVARGFQIDYDGPEEVKEYLTQFTQRHDLRGLLKIVVYDGLRYGSSYVEIVRKWECMNCDYVDDRREEVKKHLEENEGHKMINPYGRIVFLKIIDPVYMRVRRNAWGLVTGYVQLLTIPPVSLMADEIMHYRFNAMSDQYENAYGNSLLRALLFHQALIDEFEKNMAGIIHTYLKPMLIVKIGRSEPGSPAVTDDQYSAVVNAFRNRQAATDIYVRQGALISDVIVIQPPLQGLQSSEWWLNYLKEQREFELGVPRIFTDPGAMNRATAQLALQNFTTRLANIQESLSELIENAIFKPLLQEEYSNWRELIDEYGLPQLVWNPIVEEDPIQTLSVVAGLAKMGAITVNEARNKLGFPELDEEQFGDQGEQLIAQPQPAFGKGGGEGMEGAGGFATGDIAEETGGKERQEILKDLQDLADTSGLVNERTKKPE